MIETQSCKLSLVLPPPNICSHSMTIYGNQIKEATFEKFNTNVYEWRALNLLKNPLTARVHKYIYSPINIIRCPAPRIQHITDQSYAHLYNKNAEANILTVHDINPIVCYLKKLDRSLRPPLLFYYVSCYFKKFDHIITPTDTTKDYLIKLLNLPADNISVVNNPVEIDKSSAVVRKFDGINILIIGNNFYKNCTTSFEAVGNFTDRYDLSVNVHWVVSEKPDPSMVAYFRNRNSRVALNIYNNLKRHKLLELYGSCSVLLFPSLIEGFGYPIIEALRNRLPVITSNHGAMSEIAGGHCILVNPLVVLDIERALTTLFCSDTIISPDTLESAYEYSLRFNNVEFKKRILNVYESVGL